MRKLRLKEAVWLSSNWQSLDPSPGDPGGRGREGEGGIPPTSPLLFTSCLSRKPRSSELKGWLGFPVLSNLRTFFLSQSSPPTTPLGLCWSFPIFSSKPDVRSRENRCTSVMELCGTHWNPALPHWGNLCNEILTGL